MITNNLIIVLKFRANISNRNSNLDRNQSHTGWNWFMTICQQKRRAEIHRDPGWNLKYLECPKLCNSSHLKKPRILSKNQARSDGTGTGKRPSPACPSGGDQSRIKRSRYGNHVTIYEMLIDRHIPKKISVCSRRIHRLNRARLCLVFFLIFHHEIIREKKIGMNFV